MKHTTSTHTRTDSSATKEMATSARRRAATQAHQQAIATINEMFDRVDDLTAARDRLTGLAPREPDADPIQDAETLLELARRLTSAVEGLRSAALAAAAHRTRGELAADIGTKSAVLFPRPVGRLIEPARLVPLPGGDQPPVAGEHEVAS